MHEKIRMYLFRHIVDIEVKVNKNKDSRLRRGKSTKCSIFQIPKLFSGCLIEIFHARAVFKAKWTTNLQYPELSVLS